MPKEKNQHKSTAASDEKFRDFFTTTVADIPAEMVRREEEAAEEHKGLFGRLFGHAKPKQAPQAGTDLELPTGEVLLGADALAKPDGEEPLDLDLTLRTADPGTDFPQPKAEVPAAPEKPAVPDRPAPQPAPENKPKAPATPAPQPEKPRKKAAQNPKNAPDVLLPQEQQEQQEMQQLKDMLNGMAAKPKPVEETLEPICSVDVPLDDPEEPETPEKAPEPPRPTMVFAADKPLPEKKSVFRMFGDADDEKKPEVPEEPAAPEKTSPAAPVKAPEAEPETKPDEDTMSLPLEPLDAPETEPTETPVAAPAADTAEAERAGETELKTEAEDALPAEDEAPENVGEKLRRMSAELTLRCVLAGILAVVLLHVGLVADRLLPLEQPVVHRPHGGEKMVFAVLGANGLSTLALLALALRQSRPYAPDAQTLAFAHLSHLAAFAARWLPMGTAWMLVATGWLFCISLARSAAQVAHYTVWRTAAQLGSRGGLLHRYEMRLCRAHLNYADLRRSPVTRALHYCPVFVTAGSCAPELPLFVWKEGTPLLQELLPGIALPPDTAPDITRRSKIYFLPAGLPLGLCLLLTAVSRTTLPTLTLPLLVPDLFFAALLAAAFVGYRREGAWMQDDHLTLRRQKGFHLHCVCALHPDLCLTVQQSPWAVAAHRANLTLIFPGRLKQKVRSVALTELAFLQQAER